MGNRYKKAGWLILALLAAVFIFPAMSMARTDDYEGYGYSYPLIFNEQGKALIMNTYARMHGSREDYYSDRTFIPFVPLRGLCDYYGAEVDWQNYRATIYFENKTITLRPGSKTVTVLEDGVESKFMLANAPFINKDNRLLVSMQIFTELMNKKASYAMSHGLNAIRLRESGSTIGDRSDEAKEPTTPWGEKLGIATGDELWVVGNATEQNLRIFSEKFFKNNALSFDEIGSICESFLGYPLNRIASYNERSKNNEYYYASGEIAKQEYNDTKAQLKDKTKELYTAYLSPKIPNGKAWEDFLYLSFTAPREFAFKLVEVFSTNDRISGTFAGDIYEWNMGNLFVYFEAELTEQADGSWLMTKFSNPRCYIDLNSLRDAEPETYHNMIAMQDSPWFTGYLNGDYTWEYMLRQRSGLLW